MLMARKQTLVQLNDDLIAVLDEQAARRGVTRSHLIREAIEAHLKTSRDAEIDAAIVDGYTRIPPEPDPWLDALARESTRGLPPW
jgi:predicted DNA-binding protein